MSNRQIGPTESRFVSTHRAVEWGIWLVVVVGALLRLQRYVANRSFWLDESLLGLNLIEKSMRGLLKSLDYVQSAPPGFLAVEKASIGLFGEREAALRLFPFLASLVGLVLFAVVARRLLDPWAALLAVTLFAVNEPLLYQSSEAKPYTSDVAFALLILWLTLRALDRPEPPAIGWRQLALLTLVGMVAVWFSYPAVFVLAGAFLALLLREGRQGWRKRVMGLSPVAALWIGSFLIVYTASSGTITTVRNSVFAGEVHTGTRLSALARVGWVSLYDPLGFMPSLRGLAMLCLVVGVVIVATAWNPDRFALLVVPGSLAVLAALVGKYPAGGRFWLFLVPFALVLIAVAIDALLRSSRRSALLGVPLIILLVVPTVGAGLGNIAHPPKREDMRPILQTLVREWRPGDRLYIYRNAQYALRFYGECANCGVPRLPFPLRAARRGEDDGTGSQAALGSVPPVVIVGKGHRTDAESLTSLDALTGKRVWLLFSHVSGGTGGFDEQAVYLAYLDRKGRLLSAQRASGSALFLYDLSAR